MPPGGLVAVGVGTANPIGDVTSLGGRSCGAFLTADLSDKGHPKDRPDHEERETARDNPFTAQHRAVLDDVERGHRDPYDHGRPDEPDELLDPGDALLVPLEEYLMSLTVNPDLGVERA